MDETIGCKMIEDLLNDPKQFAEDAGPDQLLEEYLNGFPIETLRPLLRHRDPYVYSAALFVASELRFRASDLVDDIVPFVKDANAYIRVDALNSVMACTSYGNFDRFGHIVQALEEESTTRRLIMELISKADEQQLTAVLYDLTFETVYSRQHKAGLSFLLQDPETVTEVKVLQMIQSDDPLSRAYGAIAMRRFFRHLPHFVKRVSLSDDNYVRALAESVLKEWEVVKSFSEDVRKKVWR